MPEALEICQHVRDAMTGTDTVMLGVWVWVRPTRQRRSYPGSRARPTLRARASLACRSVGLELCGFWDASIDPQTHFQMRACVAWYAGRPASMWSVLNVPDAGLSTVCLPALRSRSPATIPRQSASRAREGSWALTDTLSTPSTIAQHDRQSLNTIDNLPT
eukprot:1862139-Rhodomonas_salina.3